MKKTLLILLALTITFILAGYQRTTGPTYPKKDKINIEGTEYNITFLRSHTNDTDAELEIILPQGYTPDIFYRYYPNGEEWYKAKKTTVQDTVKLFLPKQPAAGKLEYYLTIADYTGKQIYSNQEKPIVIRFKGVVPKTILLLHILFMFLAVLFSNLTGLYALFNIKSFRKMTFITTVLLFIGGIILGPIVQKYAFGAFWTGIPFGWDFTDNKTLLIFIGWSIATIENLRKPRPLISLSASLLMIIIYLIPHSLYGSQLDYKSGKIIQGN